MRARPFATQHEEQSRLTVATGSTAPQVHPSCNPQCLPSASFDRVLSIVYSTQVDRPPRSCTSATSGVRNSHGTAACGAAAASAGRHSGQFNASTALELCLAILWHSTTEYHTQPQKCQQSSRKQGLSVSMSAHMSCNCSVSGRCATCVPGGQLLPKECSKEEGKGCSNSCVCA